MIVNCAHPVPVRYMPPRGRVERVAYVRRTTPVELRRLTTTEFKGVDYRPPANALFRQSMGGDRDPELFSLGGRLWHRMVACSQSDDDRRAGIRNLMKPEDFIAILEGRDPGTDDFGKHFAQTPLAALVRRRGAWCGTDLAVVSRGGPEPEGMARGRVVADLHAPSEAALHALFANDIALAGDHVFVRVAGPAVVHDARGNPWALRLTLFPRMFPSDGIPSRPDRLADLLDLMGRVGFYSDGPGGIPAHDLVPRHLLGDDDIEIFAHDAVRTLALDLADLMTDDELSRRPDLAGLSARLAHEAPLSRIGVFREAGLEARLVRLLADIETVRSQDAGNPFLNLFATYIAELALPRLRAGRPMAAEDEEALVGL